MAQNPQPTSQSARIPPDVPNDPGISDALSQYLRNFALWARNGFAEQMRNDQATPGLMVRAYDTPAGSNPAVWQIQVNTAGVISTKQVGLGGKNPGP